MIIKIKMSLSHQCLIPTMAAINKTLELFVMALAHSLGFPTENLIFTPQPVTDKP